MDMWQICNLSPLVWFVLMSVSAYEHLLTSLSLSVLPARVCAQQFNAEQKKCSDLFLGLFKDQYIPFNLLTMAIARSFNSTEQKTATVNFGMEHLKHEAILKEH